MALRVGIAYNLKPTNLDPDKPEDYFAEYDSEATVHAIADALRERHHEPVLLEADESFCSRLNEAKPDIVFNIAEGLRGESRESHVPSILEHYGVPYTGSGPLTQALCLDKPLTKKLLQLSDVPTPQYAVFPVGKSAASHGLEFPLFVKPANQGSSLGISPGSLVFDDRQLVERVDYLHEVYNAPALVEQFVGGREFTVGILGNGTLYGHNYRLFPIIELNYDVLPPEHPAVYSYQFKQEFTGDEYYSCPAPLSRDEEALIYRISLAAFQVMGCRDISRVDVRFDEEGTPYVLELNPLPGMAPGFSDLPRMAEAAGVGYTDLISGILNQALRRYGMRAQALN